MSIWVVQVAVVVLFAATTGVLAAAWLRGRLGATAIVVLAAAVVAWIAAFFAIAGQWRGANDFATCEPSCAPVHYVSAVAFIASPLLVSLAAVGMVVARASRWRARRSAADENPA